MNLEIIEKAHGYNRLLWYAAYILLALIPWGIVLLATPRGFDLTDESFYLLSFSHPEDISVSFSMFGVLGNPLYELSGGRIAVMRALTVVIWLALSTFVTCLTLGSLSRSRSTRGASSSDARMRFLLILLPVAGGALYYQVWILTPSYNWLTLVGLALFWAGFLLWRESSLSARAANLGIAVLAFAATLMFWSKATSAALLIPFLLAAMALSRPYWRRLLTPRTVAWGAAGLVVGISLPLMYGFSPGSIFNILTQGIEHQQVMKPGVYSGPLVVLAVGLWKTIEYLAHSPYPMLRIYMWFPPLVAALITARLTWSRPRLRENGLRVAQFLLILGCVVNLIVLTYLFSEFIGYWALNTVMLIIVYLLAGDYVNLKLTSFPSSSNRLRAGAWVVPIFTLILIFLFGTYNDYASLSGMATFFFLLGISVLFLARDENHLNTTIARTVVPTLLLAIVWLTYAGSLTPYQQDVSAWEMNRRVSIRGGTDELMVSEEMSRYLIDLQTIAGADFQPGTPIIDLTGHSPGAAYALGGRTYGFPWLLGGYSGSNSAAVYVLDQWEQEQLDEAWILTAEQNGKRQISLSVLDEIGLDFPAAYEHLGIVRRPASQEMQALWRPSSGG